jgi:hypothetical protein
MKKCRICEIEKSETDFYKGLAQCKPCYRNKVTQYRKTNISRIRKYDRDRGNRQNSSYLSEHRKKYPIQTKAQRKVAYEISKGTIKEEPCEICQSEIRLHAHHDDYSKPLKIRWLCAAHHKQWHRDNGEGLNR